MIIGDMESIFASSLSDGKALVRNWRRGGDVHREEQRKEGAEL